MAISSLSDKHNALSEGKFRLKIVLLIFLRLIKNGFSSDLKRFKVSKKSSFDKKLVSSESLLWNADDNDLNRILTLGKVENLRVAALRLNGLLVPENQVFSFWKHIGFPSKSKGYVVGREIREGCIVPTIAGGLCQLSNALYDAALKAGFDIIERHKHTKVIKGSLAEQDRDATVKWNHIDLRFKANKAFRIEIEFTNDSLIVNFKSEERFEQKDNRHKVNKPVSNLNDCYSCGNTDCFKYPGEQKATKNKKITTFILDEKWPEYDKYIQGIASEEDFFIVPFFKNGFVKTNRYSWSIKNPRRVKSFSSVAFQRAMSIRFQSRLKANIPSQFIKFDKKIVNSIREFIPIESTHIVISQNLLPFAYEQGLLWGRTFDVLMTRLPVETIQTRLDKAYLKYPHSLTLHDFRVDRDFVELENIALTKAGKIVTPHNEIAALFNNKSLHLEWDSSSKNNIESIGKKILFPSSALGRKGAYEVRQLCKELNLEIVVSGKNIEDEYFWKGIATKHLNNTDYKEIGLIIYPAYIEHNPRQLLKAIASGIAVITTTACGISPNEKITVLPIGDFKALKQAVEHNLSNSSNPQTYQTYQTQK